MIVKYAVFWLMTVILVPSVLGESESGENFVNEWVAHIRGGWHHASRIAKRHGFHSVKTVREFEDVYSLRHVALSHRSKRSAPHLTLRLTDEPSVLWAEQQLAKRREKRENKDDNNNITVHFNDPEYENQWYILGEHTNMGHLQQLWAEGWTGKGVVVAIVDDGLDHTHPDLAPNYDANASYNLLDDIADPMPRPVKDNEHGTRCAGQVGMVANNSVCGVGIAYNCNLGGVLVLDKTVTDKEEGQAIAYNVGYVDIYSISWGPLDDGMTLSKPGRLAREAYQRGIREGRSGRGAIYVMASGNGGDHDDCNCDGYAAAVYTISVSVATQFHEKPRYTELCPSTLTTAYSSGSTSAMVATTPGRGCTDKHGGTSAATPLVSGIIALILEANPLLTWRDVQHLIVVTSKSGPLANENGWYQNGAGLCVHQAFGFGLIHSKDLMERAQKWVTVPPQAECHVHANGTAELPKEMSSGREVEVTITTDGCRGTENEVNYVEHVQLVFTMNYTYRGAVNALVVSPAGTRTLLLRKRAKDNSTDGFQDWPLMSVHTWGENPAGDWVFRVFDDGFHGINKGILQDVKLILYGTKEAPAYRNDSTAISCDPVVVRAIRAARAKAKKAMAPQSAAQTPLTANKGLGHPSQ